MAGLLRSGKPLSGTEGVLTELTKHVVAKSMDAELGEHLRTELMAFLRFGLELRRLIYSKGSWATTKALMIQVYLVLQVTENAWGMTVRNWPAVQRELINEYGSDYFHSVVPSSH